LLTAVEPAQTAFTVDWYMPHPIRQRVTRTVGHIAGKEWCHHGRSSATGYGRLQGVENIIAAPNDATSRRITDIAGRRVYDKQALSRRLLRKPESAG